MEMFLDMVSLQPFTADLDININRYFASILE